MEYISPEKVGISSENIYAFVRKFEDAGLNTHDVIISRYGKICFDAYWKPFDKNFSHRLYSVTKSFVSIAVGFLVQDGKISLDDRILEYFPEMEQYVSDEIFKAQTIRDMLMMATAKLFSNCWIKDKPADRVRYYFENNNTYTKTPGTIFNYDSNGSFVLGAMVEKVSGKTLLDFLREKCFDKIGMSDNIECLKCPGGYSWGDSALIMPAEDLLKFAQFVMNNGKYNGEQILSSDYLKEATKKQIDNCFTGDYSYGNQGYGYQIWRTYDNSFAFMGMGNQEVICVPDKEIIFVCNSDNQGIDYAKRLIYDSFFELIVRKAKDVELPENISAENRLKSYADTLTLSTARGEKTSSYADVINGKEFQLTKNSMGITKISLHFNEGHGTLRYTNCQGEKELNFGMCKNIFGMFPETGYSDETGAVSKPGHMYKCAASAAWIEERKLYIKVQIIDKYFGNLHIIVGFNKENKMGLWMQKNAEEFLNEYAGYAAEVR